MATDNKSLGRFILSGIPAAPRGVPQVDVSFDIDASGILSVTAKDKASGTTQSIKITGSTGLSKDEIEKMRKEAEEHASEDQEKKDKIEARNKADNMIYVAEKTVKDAGDKAKPEDKTAIEEKAKALKDILESGSKEDLEAKTTELSDVVQKLGASMYQQPSADGQTSPTGEDSKTDEKSNEAGPSSAGKDDKKVEEGEVVG